LICSNCGTTNPPGLKFCGECGTRLGVACTSCGAVLSPGTKFCGECGVPAPSSVASSAGGEAGGAAPGPVAERRLVSVLFADLVGFTPFAEERDAEDVRDTLTTYFELATDVITRYGGTVEKFIGDAVMAVWGAPRAHEDDAERAVRAGLELVDAVRVLGPGIQARAGVLTGEAAVTLGATNQGMVAGDLVNTAARLQSVALPGTVLVGEATHRAASRAIAFEEVGQRTLKGKAAPVAAWRALRVVSEVGGRNRAETLEAPFVGRDDELRLLKDLFHATTREQRARLVSVMGPAGIGKTRLAWEFSKYLDGLIDTVWFHDGRSPAYGDGISLWALGEMVRRRAGLIETDDEPTTRLKIAETVAEHIPDDGERRWIEPALLALLGIDTDAVASDQLFGAWRTFFERMAATAPVVLLFEDFHNADSGLIDFVDHLLEWSRAVPIYVVTLARPELLEKRPDWGAGKRNFNSIYLEPLVDGDMRELLAGLVPGLPEPAVEAIVSRADGFPLYAIEIVRMLLAEGRIALIDGVYRPVDDLTTLAVPESLTALIASRLDGLDQADRNLVQDAAVLGQSFTVVGLAAVSGVANSELEPRLGSLVARELISLEVDPRSPERGQYAFVQALIREVAYKTLARRDRKSRHLAAARFLESLDTDELAGGLAGHYLAAHANSDRGPEADALAAQARIALKAAAERAAALGANDQAVSFLEQALTVTSDPAERAGTWRRIAGVAEDAAEFETAERYLVQAVDWYRSQAMTDEAAAASAQLGQCLVFYGRVEPAIEHLTGALEVATPSDAAAAELWGQLARARMLHNEPTQAVVDADRALEAAGKVDDVAVIADALITKGTALTDGVHYREGVALLRGAHALAVTKGLTRIEFRAINNLALGLWFDAPLESIAIVQDGLDRARRIGDRAWLVQFGRLLGDLLIRSGEWDGVLAILADLEQGVVPDEDAIHFVQQHAEIEAMRGRTDEAERLLASVDEALSRITNPFQRGYHLNVRSIAALASGRLEAALALAEEAAEQSREVMQDSAELAGFIATCSSDLAGLRRATLRFDEVGALGAAGRATRAQLAAGVAAIEGRPDEAQEAYRRAHAAWRDLRLPWAEALCAIAMATLLDPAEQDVRASAEAAREILDRLGATPFIDMLDTAMARVSPAAASESSAREGAVPGQLV
jgi:class 3 adenylate cyclase/tetratricopeptide (TPR) repeat protein